MSRRRTVGMPLLAALDQLGLGRSGFANAAGRGRRKGARRTRSLGWARLGLNLSGTRYGMVTTRRRKGRRR